MEEEQTRPRAAERVTQGTPQVTTITRALRLEMQMIMMVAINSRHLTKERKASLETYQLILLRLPTRVHSCSSPTTTNGQRWKVGGARIFKYL